MFLILSFNFHYYYMPKRQVWITDNSNIKFQRIKSSFLEAMLQQSKEQRINYYDFLLVAKKLCFRFEQSSHLMALKNYFAKNKNSITVKKLADLLCISQQSMHAHEQKIIVKFNVPQTQFAPIKEQTHEDEQNQDTSEADLGHQIFEKIGSNASDEQQRQINEKTAVILSIKVDEMQNKIKALINQKQAINIINLIKQSESLNFKYEDFKGLILMFLQESRQIIKISEDDIKTLFYILDEQKKGQITQKQVQSLTQIDRISTKLKNFYRTRINRDMVKNTLFKLGKVKNNSIQIYQVKNASLLQFENIEKSIVDQSQQKSITRLKKIKLPHFGPLKGANMSNKQRETMPARMGGRNLQPEISFQRSRIQKILRLSKQQKRKDKSGDTVASKLRSLFIHKVILPREKMLQQQKDRYMRNKTINSDLFVRPDRKK